MGKLPDNDDANQLGFHGSHQRGIDDSRRIMMPNDWRPPENEREKVEYRVIAWPLQTKEYLLVLPPERYRIMMEKLHTKSLTDPNVAAFERVLGANTGKTKLDKVWRFNLPEDLAAKVGLKKEAMMVGRFDKFEIWNPERYAAQQAEDERRAAEVAVTLDL